MYKLVIATALVAFVVGDVSHILKHHPTAHVSGHEHVRTSVSSGSPVVAAILRQSFDVQPEGSYEFGYETENGIAAQEQGQVRIVAPEQVEKVAQGSFSWTSPEGEPIAISYIADANGYQPQGAVLPVAPPVPAAIQRALEFIAAHPQPEYQPLAEQKNLNVLHKRF